MAVERTSPGTVNKVLDYAIDEDEWIDEHDWIPVIGEVVCVAGGLHVGTLRLGHASGIRTTERKGGREVEIEVRWADGSDPEWIQKAYVHEVTADRAMTIALAAVHGGKKGGQP